MIHAVNTNLITWKQALTRTAWKGAILSIRIAAFCMAIFGSWGKNIAKKWRHKAGRLFLIHIAHHEATLTSPLSLVMPMRNLPRREILQRNEDIKAVDALRHRFAALPFVDKDLAEKLKKAKFHGSKSDGICFGASLCFLKRVLKARCASEEQLIALARKDMDGFSAKATGMQMLYLKLGRLDWYPEASKQALPAEAHRKSALQKLAENATRFGRLAQLMGLKLKGRPGDFLRFDCDAAVRRNFNALTQGVYELGILTRSSAHSMAYLKMDFGSYLLDPNRGLMKCGAQNPAKDLEILLKKYSGRSQYAAEGPHQLEIYPYELITKG